MVRIVSREHSSLVLILAIPFITVGIEFSCLISCGKECKLSLYQMAAQLVLAEKTLTSGAAKPSDEPVERKGAGIQ